MGKGMYKCDQRGESSISKGESKGGMGGGNSRSEGETMSMLKPERENGSAEVTFRWGVMGGEGSRVTREGSGMVK